VSHSFTNDMISLLSRARYRLGPSEPLMPGTKRNAFYNIEVAVPPGRVHITDRYLSIVEPLGVPMDRACERMYLPARWKRKAEELLASWGVKRDALLFALHPGGARSHARWPLERYAALADRLSSLPGAKILIVVGRGEKFGIDVAGRMKADAIECRVTNLRLLAAVVARAAVYIGNDTGLLHVAASVGTRTVGIYGQTDPDVWKPKGEHVAAVRSDRGEIGAVSLEDVYAAVLRMLS
jgi:ADP-heptose:LPS heptosyltransferase